MAESADIRFKINEIEKMEQTDGPQSLRKTKYAEYIRDFTAIGNPFLLLLVTLASLSHHPKFISLFTILVIGFVANEVVCSSIKFFWHKPRPNGQTFENGFEKIEAGSFPSIHASRISFVYLFLGYVHYISGNMLLLPTFLIVILIVGYSRIFLKKHFLLDVMAGYLFGGAMFFLCTFFVK